MEHCSRDTLLRELDSPLRLRILAIAARTPPDSLTASGVKAALGDEFRDARVRDVHYHLTRLQDADLVSRPDSGV